MLEPSGWSRGKNAATFLAHHKRPFPFFTTSQILGFLSLLFVNFIFSQTDVYANSLSIANVSIASRDASADTATVQFDISWSNSWRNQENYDAAWVFLKFSTDAGTTWTHATLKTSGTTPSGFSTGSGTSLEILVPSDKMGAFIQRSAIGAGSVSNTAVKFVWDYGTDGVSDAASVIVRVFGVEMVYIPAAAFYVGDNATSTAALKQGSSDNDPWYITSAAAISVTNTSSNGYYYVTSSETGEDSTGATFTIPAAYPNGYSAFYMMKYELTEGQWVDFFNTLTNTQKTTRDITSNTNGGKNSDSTVNRNTISWSSGSASTNRTDRAMGYMGWADCAAYYDWAALRPRTELEFEKAARGVLSAVSGEYAWGNTTLVSAATISGTEDGTETITTSSANATYGTTTYTGGDASSGPLRVGIFATSSSNRTTSGASYYGVMNMSDNLKEGGVTIGNSTGRSFTGTHGNGTLSANGNATNSDWPGYSGGEVTGSTGSGFRGGGYTDASSILRVSERSIEARADGTRYSYVGCRAVRTA